MGERSDSKPSVYVVSPSSLTFLWESCKRCFQLHVKYGITQTGTFPAVFRSLDRQQRAFFEGKPTTAFDASLPAGTLLCADLRLCSVPIAIAGTKVSVVFRGNIDCQAQFARGDHGIVDLKTTDPSERHVGLYPRQLHPYAIAGENPAPSFPRLAPITRLGLFCLAPTAMADGPNGTYVYQASGTWVEIDRDDAAFFSFMREVAAVLEFPGLVEPGPSCQTCQRQTALAKLDEGSPTRDVAPTQSAPPKGPRARYAIGATLQELRNFRREFPFAPPPLGP
ncbi:MAG: hypothetical protein Q8K63_09575 [Acidimicrobiales bacterium]|nr:hypothetical protein [Acidimicrobiales bacterium]